MIQYSTYNGKGTGEPCGSLPNYSMEEIMKKILSIALVALLATSAVFAGLSGKAVLNLGANFDNGAWGFANSTELSKLSITWQSEDAEKVSEGELYAGIKASFKITSETANFADNASIADYAKEAVAFLNAKGVITGDESANFKPAAYATRAEVAVMLSRVNDIFMKEVK